MTLHDYHLHLLKMTLSDEIRRCLDELNLSKIDVGSTIDIDMPYIDLVSHFADGRSVRLTFNQKPRIDYTGQDEDVLIDELALKMMRTEVTVIRNVFDRRD